MADLFGPGSGLNKTKQKLHKKHLQNLVYNCIILKVACADIVGRLMWLPIILKMCYCGSMVEQIIRNQLVALVLWKLNRQKYAGVAQW